MDLPLSPLAGKVNLLEGEALARRDRNRSYMMSLTVDNLLLSHRLEAGLIHLPYMPENIHKGWDSPISEIRGTVAGHWLSAAARIFSETGDMELKSRADFIVSEIARCQKEHLNGWAFPIPEKYLYWLKRGKRVWAPQYVCHKNMMGLLDMHTFAGNQEAMDILLKCADWFYNFTNDISREQMNEMMEFEETGGIMEHWANLYALTGNDRHLELMKRYERPLLFEPLYRGEDVLTNMHANTTIPEVHGAARAYEVTGEERYRRIVENYWKLVVNRRGMYATGGQTSGEVWTPMDKQSARLGELNQEHCTVYNMMRLSEYLLRWTGKAEYADYWERNLYNGIFAQGYWKGRNIFMAGDPITPETGLVAYYLPLTAGSRKKWGSETEHFWCCHNTLMQANANHREGIFYAHEGGVTVCQYMPSKLEATHSGVTVKIEQSFDMRTGELFRIRPVEGQAHSRPRDIQVCFKINAEAPVEFTLKLRIPWWLKEEMKCFVNGNEVKWDNDGKGFACISKAWHNDHVRVVLPKGLTCWPLPDSPDTVAFMDGPVVLAGLVEEERMLYGDIDNPDTLLIPDDELQWLSWTNGWKTVNQPIGWKFKPLYEIGNETYTVYFPVKDKR